MLWNLGSIREKLSPYNIRENLSPSNIREKLEFSSTAKGDIHQLFHPYYIVNLLLAFSFLFVKLTRPFVKCSSNL